MLHNCARTAVFQAKNRPSSPPYVIESEQQAPGRLRLLNRRTLAKNMTIVAVPCCKRPSLPIEIVWSSCCTNTRSAQKHPKTLCYNAYLTTTYAKLGRFVISRSTSGQLAQPELFLRKKLGLESPVKLRMHGHLHGCHEKFEANTIVTSQASGEAAA